MDIMPPEEIEAKKEKVNLFALYVSIISIMIIVTVGAGLGILLYWFFSLIFFL